MNTYRHTLSEDDTISWRRALAQTTDGLLCQRFILATVLEVTKHGGYQGWVITDQDGEELARGDLYSIVLTHKPDYERLVSFSQPPQ